MKQVLNLVEKEAYTNSSLMIIRNEDFAPYRDIN